MKKKQIGVGYSKRWFSLEGGTLYFMKVCGDPPATEPSPEPGHSLDAVRDPPTHPRYQQMRGERDPGRHSPLLVGPLAPSSIPH
jgi:hypothetical protein